MFANKRDRTLRLFWFYFYLELKIEFWIAKGSHQKNDRKFHTLREISKQDQMSNRNDSIFQWLQMENGLIILSHWLSYPQSRDAIASKNRDPPTWISQQFFWVSRCKIAYPTSPDGWHGDHGCYFFRFRSTNVHQTNGITTALLFLVPIGWSPMDRYLFDPMYVTLFNVSC